MASDGAYDVLWNFLREFFNYEHYAVAIGNARSRIASDPRYRERWTTIRTAIESRALAPSQPLTLVHEAANQVLDENSDEEAYVWLDKMVANVERRDGVVEEY